MKYLLSALLFLLFITIPIKVSADDCTSRRSGDSCGAYIKNIDATNCQTCYGTCTGNPLSCNNSSSDYCSSTYPCSGDATTPAPPIIPPASSLPTLAPQSGDDLFIGVHLPNSAAIDRLVPSQYSFQWAKFQYQLGSNDDLEGWIKHAKESTAGNNKNYGVLISVAKNLAGIEQLQNLPYSGTQENGIPLFTQKYCPWDDELDSYDRIIGYENCPTKEQPNRTCPIKETVKIPAKTDNGYIKFRDQMRALASRLQGVEAVEIWNEPNLAKEWSNPDPGQGTLGPVNPENYTNFFICGVKGLRKGGYNGKVITAGLAPLTGNTNGNWDDFDFFNRFYDAYKNSMSSRENPHGDDIYAFGWHANVADNLKPADTSVNGFQRFSKILIGKGKPIWLTEFGWDRSKLPGQDDYEKRQLQAHYIAQAYDVIKNSPTYSNNVQAMFVWNFGFTKAGKNTNEFVNWDIEGTTPQGKLCQPNTEITKYRKDRGSTRYVQDTSLTDDVIVATVAGTALLPKVVIEAASKSAEAGIKTDPETRVDAKKGFLDNIPGLVGIFNLLDKLLSVIGLKIPFCGFAGLSDEFCKPNVSIGTTEKPDAKYKLVPGKNTPKFTSQTKILGQAGVSIDMELSPEEKDCNIGQLTDPSIVDIGNQNLNELSETMGTTTGFYGNGMPNFKILTPDDWEALIKDQMQKDNLNIGSKLFNQDKRSPDVYLRKQVFCKGNYPNGICPFEPTPAPK